MAIFVFRDSSDSWRIFDDKSAVSSWKRWACEIVHRAICPIVSNSLIAFCMSFCILLKLPRGIWRSLVHLIVLHRLATLEVVSVLLQETLEDPTDLFIFNRDGLQNGNHLRNSVSEFVFAINSFVV